MGRPRSYKPEELEVKIEEYFKYVEEINKERKLRRFEGEKPKPVTISGLCDFLGIHMDTWNEYSKLEEYSDSIKRAKLKVMNFVEEGLLSGSLNAIGAIFNLKNNFDWTDKVEVKSEIKTSSESITPEVADQILQDAINRSKT